MIYTIYKTARALRSMSADDLDGLQVELEDGEWDTVGNLVSLGGGDEYFSTNSGTVRIGWDAEGGFYVEGV